MQLCNMLSVRLPHTWLSLQTKHIMGPRARQGRRVAPAHKREWDGVLPQVLREDHQRCDHGQAQLQQSRHRNGLHALLFYPMVISFMSG